MSRIAVIAGSGAAFMRTPATPVTTATTEWGDPSAPLLSWQQHGHELFVLRRHGAGGNIPPHAINYRANIACLAELKPDWVIAINTVGGIHAECVPGRLVLPAQLIDYSWGRAHSFYNGAVDVPTDYVDFTEPFAPELRARLISAAQTAAVDCIHEGVYGVTQGPRLESAAEINRLERDGCTVVGMTAMPEAGLAREAGLQYASCCCVVNAAAGRSTQPIHSEIEAFMQRGMDEVARLLEAFLASL